MENYRHLSWFLGPKAENAEVFEQLLLEIVRDYMHWRRNYFPGDKILLTRSMQRDLANEHDLLTQHLQQLMAELRRNFPFYSPRYVAHELSDTVMPSMLGYIAGLLFNPNNITPEAAPVTTEQEIFACSKILAMLGFTAPPELPGASEKPLDYYTKKSASEFGWAHLTSGGTVANIEALWVARQVRYFPLSVQEVSLKLDLAIGINLADGTSKDIKLVDPYDLLLIKPNEAIYLLPKFIKAFGDHPNNKDVSGTMLQDAAWDVLGKSDFSLSSGVAKAFHKFRPVILTAGSRHYSWTKAANLLGLGSDSIIHVKTDKNFRLDVTDLKKKLIALKQQKQVPLCVICAAGTTEEGAVDPIHAVVDLRGELEKEFGLSFWLHIDAAWGGFFRTLFAMTERDELLALASRIGRKYKLPLIDDDLLAWHDAFAQLIGNLASPVSTQGSEKPPKPESAADHGEPTDPFQLKMQQHLKIMRTFLDAGDEARYMELLEQIPSRFKGRAGGEGLETMRLTADDKLSFLRQFVHDQIELRYGGTSKSITVNWPDPSVGYAFMAFPKAESITVDPHKMGYALYPSGCIAFRNDRVRLFVMQKAPYITSADRNPRFHVPPRHTNLDDSPHKLRHTIVESFSPYILEGSRPGAAAAALWLSLQSIPPDMRNHGLIVRESILAARELHEWLVHWNAFVDQESSGADYRFIPLMAHTPDTNLVTFVVKKKTSPALADMNKLTQSVYRHFSIRSELGEREFSYAQPFFLSHTTLNRHEYPAAGISDFFARCEMNPQAHSDYGREGLDVLRATVMNPYIRSSRRIAGQDFARLLVQELADQAQARVREI